LEAIAPLAPPPQFTPVLRCKRRVFGRLLNSELEKMWKETLESNFNILSKKLSRSWISNPHCVRYYYGARGHIYNLCIDYKNYAIIYAATYTIYVIFLRAARRATQNGDREYLLQKFRLPYSRGCSKVATDIRQHTTVI
jgi:hypothetical protein